jgi:hypothetical protein
MTIHFQAVARLKTSGAKNPLHHASVWRPQWATLPLHTEVPALDLKCENTRGAREKNLANILYNIISLRTVARKHSL